MASIGEKIAVIIPGVHNVGVWGQHHSVLSVPPLKLNTKIRERGTDVSSEAAHKHASMQKVQVSIPSVFPVQQTTTA